MRILPTLLDFLLKIKGAAGGWGMTLTLPGPVFMIRMRLLCFCAIGVAVRPEIIPVEPDLGNASVGNLVPCFRFGPTEVPGGPASEHPPTDNPLRVTLANDPGRLLWPKDRVDAGKRTVSG
jgi:hypothetical protein